MIADSLELEQAGVNDRPSTITEVNFKVAGKIMRLVYMLEGLVEVQEVHAKAYFSNEVMERLSQ